MTRRAEYKNIEKDAIQWDDDFNQNLLNLGLNDFPIRLPIHIGDESDITTTFPPGRWKYCILLVDHTSLGQSLYLSGGTTWGRLVVLSTPITPTAQTYERKNLIQIQNGDINYKAIFDINYNVLGQSGAGPLTNPMNFPIHAGDETDLETTFPAVDWDNCGICVYNTTLGFSLYTSNSVIWKRQF